MIVDTVDLETLAVGGVSICFGTLNTVVLSMGGRRSLGELIEDVEVSLVANLLNDTVLFEKVVCDVGTDRFALCVEHDFKILSMTRRVIVPERLGATKGLEERVGSQNHILDVLNARIGATTDGSDVLHDTLRCFGLACTGFARDDNALILLVCVHVVVSTFGDGKDVWCHLETVLASIGLEDVFGVDTEIAERVDRDEYIADVGIDFCILETLLEILVDSFVGDLG